MIDSVYNTLTECAIYMGSEIMFGVLVYNRGNGKLFYSIASFAGSEQLKPVVLRLIFTQSKIVSYFEHRNYSRRRILIYFILSNSKPSMLQWCYYLHQLSIGKTTENYTIEFMSIPNCIDYRRHHRIYYFLDVELQLF